MPPSILFNDLRCAELPKVAYFLFPLVKKSVKNCTKIGQLSLAVQVHPVRPQNLVRFVPAMRRNVYEKLKPLVTDKCPFVNLPETGRARWGEILDAEKMKKCVWVRPKLVAVVEFLEWTEGDRLRHSKFLALRDDKEARGAVKE